MATKELTFKGKSIADLRNLTIQEFAQLLPARQRRTLTRGFTEPQKKLLKKLPRGKTIETHLRDMIIVPEMVERTIKIHDGRNFIPVMITVEMLGHALGEFVMTRRTVKHSAPGIGATKSSAAMSVK